MPVVRKISIRASLSFAIIQSLTRRQNPDRVDTMDWRDIRTVDAGRNFGLARRRTLVSRGL